MQYFTLNGAKAVFTPLMKAALAPKAPFSLSMKAISALTLASMASIIAPTAPLPPPILPLTPSNHTLFDIKGSILVLTPPTPITTRYSGKHFNRNQKKTSKEDHSLKIIYLIKKNKLIQRIM